MDSVSLAAQFVAAAFRGRDAEFFCDDPTHVYLPYVREMANVLLANGVAVLHAGRSREGFWTTITDVLKFCKRCIMRVFTGKFSGRGMWYLLGFEDHVFGQRKMNE